MRLQGVGCRVGSLVGIFAFVGLALFFHGLLLPASAGEEVMRDGVPHIRNGARPSEGVDVLRVEELWRVGGDADEENLFGVIVQALPDEQGNIYLLDMQLGEVQVFSPQGEKIATLSREGDGPGEVRTPSDMCFLPSGALGIVQTFPGKLIKIDREGIPAGEVTLGAGDPAEGGFKVLIDAKCRGDHLVLAGMAIEQAGTGQNRTSFLAGFSESGQELTRYLAMDTKLDFEKFEVIEKDQYFVYPRRWDVGPDGRVYAAPARDEYVIHVYGPDGTLERVIERVFENRKRTEEELDRIRSAIEAQTRQVPFEVKTEICESEPVISGMRIGPDGMLWVSSNRSAHQQPEGVLMTYDLFDSKGHFVKELQVACEGDGANDGFIMLSDDRAILIKGLVSGATALQGGLGGGGGEQDEAPMEIVYYKVRS